MSEIWKNVVGYESLYQVSDLGNIKSLDKYIKGKGNSIVLRKGKILKKSIDKDGYLITGLTKDGVLKTKKIHRLVLEAFTPNPHNKPQVNHINGVKNDNYVNNLEWVTQSENEKHSYCILGKKVRKGINSNLCKLTEKEVLEIRKSILSRSELAFKYNVCNGTIDKIINRINWKHL
jgi:hypothetical protein